MTRVEHGDDARVRVIHDRVAQLRAEGRWRRQRVQLPAFVGGALIACVGGALAVLHGRLLRAVGLGCAHLGLWLALLALRPQDRQSVRLLTAASTVFLVAVAIDIALPRGTETVHPGTSIARALAAAQIASAATSALASAACLLVLVADVAFGASPRLTLRRCWQTLGSTYILFACVLYMPKAVFAFAAPSSVAHLQLAREALVPLIAVAIGLGCTAFWEPLRTSVHELLARIGEGVSAAAGIAELIGGLPPAEVLARARATFRALPASALTLEHFTLPHAPTIGPQRSAGALSRTSGASVGRPSSSAGGVSPHWRCARVAPSCAAGARVSTPRASFAMSAAELYATSSPVQLGSVDAFISHSWHDDPASKLDAIQKWRRRFVRTHGREPTVWFDRLCIDQDDIAAQLPALPVYLAGCKSLLALQGPTYFQRLWCVLELHIFHQMGGSLDQIQFVQLDTPLSPLRLPGSPLSRPSGSHALGADVPDFDFDVRTAQVTDPLDQSRLLAVIEGSGEGVAAFNVWVRSMLKLAAARHKREQRDDACSAASGAEKPHQPRPSFRAPALPWEQHGGSRSAYSTASTSLVASMPATRSVSSASKTGA